MSTPTPTLTGAYTCTHHNDRERAACPVCLVTTLTTERDQLRAQLHALNLICGTTDADKFTTWVDRANARAERAEAELAAERARMADLVADLNDACITLESAKNDCDDYAMQNTAFKLMAVSNVLLQYIPNAAMKEGAK